jgi:hypothetical protein
LKRNAKIRSKMGSILLFFGGNFDIFGIMPKKQEFELKFESLALKRIQKSTFLVCKISYDKRGKMNVKIVAYQNIRF